MTACCGAGWRWRSLFLKQTIESGARVVGIARGCDVGGRIGGCGRRGCRIARYGDTRFKQSAIVGLILDDNAHGDGLDALETRRRLKIRALLAAVQRGVALGAFRRKLGACQKSGGTIEAAGGGYGLHQAREARAGDIERRTRAGWTRTFVTAVIVAPGEVAVCFLIAALLVLAISVHVASWRSLNVNAAHALRIGDRKIFDARRQSNQTWGTCGTGLLTNCLNHYVPRNGRGIQLNLLRYLVIGRKVPIH